MLLIFRSERGCASSHSTSYDLCVYLRGTLFLRDILELGVRGTKNGTANGSGQEHGTLYQGVGNTWRFSVLTIWTDDFVCFKEANWVEPRANRGLKERVNQNTHCYSWEGSSCKSCTNVELIGMDIFCSIAAVEQFRSEEIRLTRVYLVAALLGLGFILSPFSFRVFQTQPDEVY